MDPIELPTGRARGQRRDPYAEVERLQRALLTTEAALHVERRRVELLESRVRELLSVAAWRGARREG